MTQEHWKIVTKDREDLDFCHASLSDSREKKRSLVAITLRPTCEWAQPEELLSILRDREFTDFWQLFLFPEISESDWVIPGPVPEKVSFNVEDLANRAKYFVFLGEDPDEPFAHSPALERLRWAVERIQSLNPDAVFVRPPVMGSLQQETLLPDFLPVSIGARPGKVG